MIIIQAYYSNYFIERNREYHTTLPSHLIFSKTIIMITSLSWFFNTDTDYNQISYDKDKDIESLNYAAIKCPKCGAVGFFIIMADIADTFLTAVTNLSVYSVLDAKNVFPPMLCFLMFYHHLHKKKSHVHPDFWEATSFLFLHAECSKSCSYTFPCAE